MTVSVAMLKVMEEQGFRPDVTAGLSLGEYCALAASGVMTRRTPSLRCAAGASSCRRPFPPGSGE